MMQLLDFTFQGFWHFVGMFILFWLLCQTLICIVGILRTAKTERPQEEVDAARLEERAKIAAWLRGDWSGYDTAQRAKLFAGLIEAGEHLK